MKRGSTISEVLVTLAIVGVGGIMLTTGRWREGVSLESHWLDIAVLVVAVLACLAVWAWTTPSHRRPFIALGIALGGLLLGLGIGAVFMFYGILGMLICSAVSFAVLCYLLSRKETAQ